MERDPRPFQAVTIGMTSVEQGRQRFFKDDHYIGPPLALWRCNLTALSQRYNLYFVANQDHVAVYQPDFPAQKLHCEPKLTIPPSLAVHAEGYIDRDRPHGINHLIVGDLGTEEVLLLATDSGNIAAYHTKAIDEAIKREPRTFSPDARSDLVGLRPFFTHWVEESAWGLAIHRQARMIAVSANKPYNPVSTDLTAKITVFAFALSHKDTSRSQHRGDERAAAREHREWYDWRPYQSTGAIPNRNRNFKIVLGGDNGHINNIPSISFINSPQDATGSWLLSTDITGMMKLWRIWQGTCHANYDCEGSQLGLNMIRQRDAGWLVAALDPSYFRPAYSMDQFCGYHRPRPAPQYHGHPAESYDITNIVRLKTPGRSQRHPLLGQDSDYESDEEEVEEINDEWSDEEVEEEEEEDHRRNLVLGLHSLRLPSDHALTASQQRESPNDLQTPILTVPSPVTATVPSIAESRADTALTNPFLSLELVDNDSEEDDTDAEYVSEEEDDRSSSGGPGSPHTQTTSVDLEPPGQFHSKQPTKEPSPTPPKRPRNDLNHNSEQASHVPTVVALQCSQFHVRLINIPKARSPHFFCANILTQDLPERVERSGLGHLTRLSMMQQIPELGIVIIASQLGRVAVCSLTKHLANGALGMRVDWILPTQRQERAGHRPPHPLLGVAVAPIQGLAHTPENASTDDWAQDRTMDGVKTTFDRHVLVLDGQKQYHSYVSDADSSDEASSHPHARKFNHPGRESERGPSRTRPHRKRARRSQSTIGNSNSNPVPRSPASSSSQPHTSTAATSSPSTQPRSSSSSLSSRASTQSRPFPPLDHTDPWAAVESSRRYRLMLTYLDSTVLTYEISRSVEREDIRSDSSSQSQSSGKDGQVSKQENRTNEAESLKATASPFALTPQVPLAGTNGVSTSSTLVATATPTTAPIEGASSTYAPSDEQSDSESNDSSEDAMDLEALD